MRKLLITTLLFTCIYSVKGQFFQFSQRHFTPQRVNPASVGGTDYLHAFMNFRNQTTSGDFSLLSTTLDLSYPVSWGGSRRGGVGVYLMDDRAATRGIYSIQEAGFSTAASISTGPRSSFNLGLGLGYQRRSYDLGGLSTGSQFIPDRGFDLSLNNGENFNELNTDFLRWNVGLSWREEGTNDQPVSYFGIAAFDINEPDESVIGGESFIPITFLAEGGLRLKETRDYALYAEAFAFGNEENYSAQLGGMWQTEVIRDQYLKVRARYSTENFVMIGATIEKDNFLIGASYDLAVGKSFTSNQSAFEVGVGWKLFVKPKGRKKPKKSKDPQTKEQEATPADSLVLEKPDLEEVPEEEQNPVLPDTTVTQPQRPVEQPETPQPEKETELKIGEPVTTGRVIDKYEVRLPFRFNSSDLSEEFSRFLDEVVRRLKANPAQIVQIVGHTDNVGSEEVNQRISLARARAAADYLIAQGIAISRIEIEGKGEAIPLSSNDTAAGRALNRRVEITIIEPENR